MIYSLTQRLYKKLLSDSEQEFKSLVWQGDSFSRNKHDDEKVINVINQDFGIKGKVTAVQIRR